MGADPYTIGGGAILGLIKNHEDQAQSERDRELAATTQRYSPWTGLKAGPIGTYASPIAAAFQGGVSGAGLGQQLAQATGQQNLNDALIKKLGGAPAAQPNDTQSATTDAAAPAPVAQDGQPGFLGPPAALMPQAKPQVASIWNGVGTGGRYRSNQYGMN